MVAESVCVCVYERGLRYVGHLAGDVGEEEPGGRGLLVQSGLLQVGLELKSVHGCGEV